MHLRTYAEVVALVQNLVRDTTPARWTAAEVKRQINRALESWADRVSVNAVYTISGGWVLDQFEYALPVYVQGAIQPQVKYSLTTDPSDTVELWTDVRRFEVFPNTSGGQTLHIKDSLSELASSSDARILFRARNSPAPTTDPTLSSECLAAATSAVLGAAVDVADVGWVKMEGEWIQYAGVTRSASATTLNNLVRGLWGTTAATHAATTTTVYWGINAPKIELFNQLYDQVMSYMHEMFITDGSPKEQETHERMMLFYEERANRYWRRHVPRATQMVLAERAF